MAQDIVNENQKISYTNLDFSSIYTEVLDLIKQLTYRWDPSISDESDPGVVLVKLSSLIADKCNYNIDKNVLETFPLSVTQNGNARQIYDQLGYYMDWYESAQVPVYLSWIGDTTDSTISYTIPKFTAITDSDQGHIYSLIGAEGVDDVVVSDTILTTDGKNVNVIAMEGTPVQYQFENEKVITSQMVDPISRRLYFPYSYIPQNGVFIKNTGQENYSSWKRVNNLYEQSYNELRYVFGYDSNSDTCFLEFPDNYSELFGNGIEITYLLVPQETSNIPAQSLVQFMSPITVGGESQVILDSSNVKIVNYVGSEGHKDIESIDDAYINYKRTVGTFNTLITLRDYLNFIRSKELDICSNAFVCDRTNDIQSVYKIISNQHDLDTLIIKVEKLIDKTTLESTFDYEFVRSSDSSMINDKKYYEIVNDTLSEVTVSGSYSPKEEGWYELKGVAPKSYEALSPFSLKFYLLRKAISLDSKTAYNQTFSVMKPYPDFDVLLGDTSHLEHTFENILPLGENSYIKSQDEFWSNTKSYWKYDVDYNTYDLISNVEDYDGAPKDNSNVYEIDVEALLPHTVLFKAIYPVTFNISTFNVLDEDTQTAISSKIISNLYSNVNSSQVDFGLPISIDYLTEIAKNSDDRIKSVTVDPVDYSLYATYYNKEEDTYYEIEVDNNMNNYSPGSYRNFSEIVAALTKKDIVCKSILAGTSQLLVPDDSFIYHLSQKYVDYVDGISNITSEAIIDIQNDSVTTYSSDNNNTFIRKSYTLKDNETLSLYRPNFDSKQDYLNGVHFEYVLYSGIGEDESYKLSSNEYLILYNPIKAEDGSTISGYTAHAYSNGAIIHSTFEIESQSSMSSLSGFARSKIVPYFVVNPLRDYYEVSTYNENNITEIRNSSTIINNAILGTNQISAKEISTLSLYVSDKYKFFWILSEPTYPNNSNLKSYTLFGDFNSETDNKYSEEINTYTLKNGEMLLYTNENGTEIEVLPPGTTLVRNCGVDIASYTEINNSLYYVCIDDVSHILEDSTFDFLVDEGYMIEPKENGLYEVSGYTEPVELAEDANPYELDLYELVLHEDNTTSFIPTYDTKIEKDPDTGEDKEYYDPQFIRTEDTIAIEGKYYYVLVMRKEEGWYVKNITTDEDGTEREIYVSDKLETGCFKEVDLYSPVTIGNKNYYRLYDPQDLGLYEIVSYNENKFVDSYKLNNSSLVTNQNRYVSTNDTSIINRNVLSDTKYSNIEIDDIGTYTTINMADVASSSPEVMGLLNPTEYKKYYTISASPTEDTTTVLSKNYYNREGESPNFIYNKVVVEEGDNPHALGYYEVQYEEVELTYLDDPNSMKLYEIDDGNFVPTQDSRPKVEAVEKTSSVELFKEVESLFTSNMENSGYYYKPSSINNNYYYNVIKDNYAYENAGEVLVEYEGASNKSPLEYLYYLFSNSTLPDNLSGDTLLTSVSDRWNYSVTYQRPYDKVVNYTPSTSYSYGDIVRYPSSTGLTYRCIVTKSSSSWVADEWKRSEASWATFAFKVGGSISDIGSDYEGKYIKVSSTGIINSTINNLRYIFPALDGDANAVVSNFYISASWYGSFNTEAKGLVDTQNYYIISDSTSDNALFSYNGVAISSENIKFNYLDSDHKLCCLFPNSKNDVASKGIISIFFLPKFFRFNDFVKYTNKKYYEAKEFYNRNCGEIKAWSCTALDADYVRENISNNIGSLWMPLQNNTSLTIIKNEILSFSAGDTIMVEANETSESYVVWPTFSNTECILDLDAYNISYQRKNEEIMELPTVSVDDYKWRGYSTLVLNTSNTSGQKLEHNHSLKLYDSKLRIEPIAVIRGDSKKDITFQLKYPVENKSGTYIDVSTLDMLGESVSNKLYAFIPYSNKADLYSYNTTDYKTYLYFNSSSSGEPPVYSPSEISLPIGLPSGNYLLGMNMKDNINLTIIYNNIVTSEDGSCNIDCPAVNTDEAVGNMKYTFDPDYINYLHSYVDNDKFEFTGDKYDYIELIIDSEYKKIKLPSLVTYTLDKSPYELGWYYELNNEYKKVDSTYTEKGTDILEKIDPSTYETYTSPVEECWYELDGDDYKLTLDVEIVSGKDYYKEPDLYASISDIESSLDFAIDYTEGPATYYIQDIFKFNENPDLEEGFNDIKEKIKRLDIDNEYNYTFVPKSNDLIENPLDPKSFWNSNHVYNNFIIPQLNFDKLNCKYITTKMNK